jgi:hypothetical protein
LHEVDIDSVLPEHALPNTSEKTAGIDVTNGLEQLNVGNLGFGNFAWQPSPAAALHRLSARPRSAAAFWL